MSDQILLKDTEFYIVTVTSTIMFILSCFGSICVLYRTFRQWNFIKGDLFEKKSMMAYRLPFYTSCLDFFENSFFLANILHTAIYASVFEEPACSAISAILWGFDTINLSLYLVISITSYLRIISNCKRVLCFGKYDYKLWLYVILISSIFQLINMHNNGARKYWCSGKGRQIISSIILFCLIIITLMIMLFCFIRIYIKIRKIKFASTDIEKRASKKIISYVLVFTIHWIPILAQNLGRLLKIEQPWIYITKSSGHALGAIGNAALYLIYEGWKPQMLKYNENEIKIEVNYEIKTTIEPYKLEIDFDTMEMPPFI